MLAHPPRKCSRRHVRAVQQDQLAIAALSADLLPVRLPGPRQHRLRQAPDAERPGLLGRGLRRGRRHLLHRLRAVRDPEQPDAAAHWRAQDLQPHPGAVGHYLGLHAVRARCADVLRHALPARHLRSGLRAGHDLLPVVLVRAAAHGARHRHRLPGRADRRHSGRAGLGVADDLARRRRQPRRLAMDVPGGGPALRACWACWR